MIETVVTNELHEFLALADEWDALWVRDAGGLPFLRAAAVAAAWGSGAAGAAPFAVCARDRGVLLGAGVFAEHGEVAARIVGPPFADYWDLLLDPNGDQESLLRELLGTALERGLVADLADVPEEGRARAFVDLARRIGRPALLRRTYACPFIDLAHNTRGLRRLRHKHRRTLEAAERAGARVECHETPGEVEGTLPVLLNLHLRRMRELGRRTPFATPAGRDFLTALCVGLAKRDEAEIGAVYVDGNPAALSVGLVCRRKYFYYVTAYDPRYADLSPGSYLLARLIERAQDRGCVEFDFMKGDEPYKLRWSTGVRFNARCFIGQPGFVGRMGVRLAWLAVGLRIHGGRSALIRRLYGLASRSRA
jgi:CelD/BcsL family acetyltransferase involved in cellulose biosynthesis